VIVVFRVTDGQSGHLMTTYASPLPLLSLSDPKRTPIPLLLPAMSLWLSPLSAASSSLWFFRDNEREFRLLFTLNGTASDLLKHSVD
jgi:hypothetical protein